MEEVEVLDAEVEDELVEKGVRAIAKMTFNFDWSKYTETYTQEVKELVEKKFIGEELDVGELKYLKPVQLKLNWKRCWKNRTW